jgi:exopolysaccharide production protein ExoZ
MLEALPPRRSSVLRNVQGLRAVAALLVVLMHMQLPRNGLDIFPHPLLRVFQDFGNFGVDLFFAISGFIMLVTNWDHFARPGASRRFLLHRAIRIYPAYWLSIVPVFLAFMLARDRVMTGHVNGRTDLLASLLLYPQPVQHVLLPVSWTLVFELTFYLLFAVVLAFKRRYIVPFLGLWFCAQIALWFAFDSSSNAYLKYAATALPIEFIFGIVAGIAYVRGKMPNPGAIFAVGLLLAGGVWASCIVLHQLPFTTSMGRVVAFGIPAALVLYGAVAREAEGAVWAPIWLVVVGDASYALYLWHFSLIAVIRQIVLRLHPTGVVAEVAVLAASLAIIVSISLAIYRYFERPVTKALNGLVARQRTAAGGRGIGRLLPITANRLED